MKRFSAMTYAKAAWLVCIATALMVIRVFPLPYCPVGEPGFYALLALIALTFPACFVVLWPLYALDIKPHATLMIFLVLVAAWVQWFIVLPWLWHKWKARKAQMADAQS
ncbi:MAG: hypothetical protein IJR28_01250 [Ottowia sp.]|nr:hypothetical protein [Ottowia sp.]